MRIIYPEELNREFDLIVPYVDHVEKDRVVFKHETPENILKHYEHYLQETKRIRAQSL